MIAPQTSTISNLLLVGMVIESRLVLDTATTAHKTARLLKPKHRPSTLRRSWTTTTHSRIKYHLYEKVSSAGRSDGRFRFMRKHKTRKHELLSFNALDAEISSAKCHTFSSNPSFEITSPLSFPKF